MRIIKIILGVVICLIAGSYTLLKLGLLISESYLLRDAKLAIFYFLFFSLGILLIVVGIKLIRGGLRKHP
jgi:hypothetical protein